jgi:hypothetical protein
VIVTSHEFPVVLMFRDFFGLGVSVVAIGVRNRGIGAVAETEPLVAIGRCVASPSAPICVTAGSTSFRTQTTANSLYWTGNEDYSGTT